MKYNKAEIMRVSHEKCRIGQFNTLSEALKHTRFEEKFEIWYERTHATDEEDYWYDD